MKSRVIPTLAVLTFIFLSIPITTAPTQASQNRIVLMDSAHRDPQGVPLDSDLLALLQPDGRLGQLVFTPEKRPRTWYIDAELIEDVQAISTKETVAQDWLAKLKRVSSKDLIIALPYAHPDIATLKRIAPTELNYYYTVSKSRLQNFFNRALGSDRNFRWVTGTRKIRSETLRSYSVARKSINLLRSVIPSDQLDLPRSRLAMLLSTDTDSQEQFQFTQIANSMVSEQTHKLRIVAGKYRLSSQHEKVPVTLINDFNAPVEVALRFTPLNSRIKVNDIEKITIAPHSKLQLSVPFTVIASGTAAVLAQFTNSRGTPVADSVLLSLNLSVISPAVAWFTTGAAILLFLAALTQSVRRIRRSKK